MDTDEYVLRRIVSGVENEEVLRRMIERKVLEQEERRKRAVMVKNRILKVLKIHSWVPVIGSYLGYRALICSRCGKVKIEEEKRISFDDICPFLVLSFIGGVFTLGGLFDRFLLVGGIPTLCFAILSIFWVWHKKYWKRDQS